MILFNRYCHVYMDEAGGDESGSGGGGSPAEESVAQVAEPDVALDIGIKEDTSSDEGIVEAPEGSVVSYAETGDPGLDMALGFIGKLGLGPAHPTVLAARQGDFTYLKAHLAGLGTKATGWEQYIALAERAYTSRAAAQKETQEKTKGIILDTVGGEESWVAIQAWARDNADDSEREEINGMIAKGGQSARAAALLLSNLYNVAHGGVQNPKSATKDVPGQQARASSGALSPTEYAAEVQALSKRIGGHRMDGSPEYAQLKQRRSMYRG